MNSQELEAALRALAAKSAGAQAPERVESALLDAFRERDRTRGVEHHWPRWLALVATLCVVAGASAVWLGRSRPQPPPPRALPAVRQEAPAPQLAQPVLKQVRRFPRRRARAPLATREVATDFFPLDDAASLAPLESAQVLRVRVPRATLARFGLPVSQDRITEPVQADVVFGQDGIARAIRFVK